MKLSPWLTGGICGLSLLGAVALLLGIWIPGQVPFGEEGVVGNLPTLPQMIKKKEAVFQQAAKNESAMKARTAHSRAHRTFVSRTLVFLPDETQAEPVQPLKPEMVTEDGIQVGWKQKFGFDPAEPQIRDEDPDGDGFSNLEEFQAGTDPLDRQNSPAKESKLRSRAAEPVAMQVFFTAKSGGIYTIRFQIGPKRSEIKSTPGKDFWVLREGGLVEIFEDEKKALEESAKARSNGGAGYLIPLTFASYEDRVEKVKDASTGGIEVEKDNSFVVLERKDGLRRSEKILLSTPASPRPLVWDVGDIRFFTPVEGGGEIGPFRLGQSFEFEGKKFSIVGREGAKIELTGADGKSFWVPPETTKAVPPSP